MIKEKKICVFAYNFKHKKTQDGIINLVLSGNAPDLVVLQDWKKLDIKRSKIRYTPKDLYLHDPKIILDKLSIPYIILDHDSEGLFNLLSNYKFKIGIILGSRIIPKKIIDKFEIGIINAHPGILPLNRGLDTIKWAILREIEQGVTTHLIDEKIDRGLLIDKKNINIYKDDNLLDLYIRISDLEQKMLIESIDMILYQNFIPKEKLGVGHYNEFLNVKKESNLEIYFEEYKEKFYCE